jgi:hypothetical protein
LTALSSNSIVTQRALALVLRGGFVSVGLVLALCVGCKNGQSPAAKWLKPSPSKRLANLQVFYGWPSGFDGAASPRAAAEKLARYDAVVLGGGLERAAHADHAKAKQVIAAIGKRAQVFGYIPLGHKTGLKIEQIAARVALWKAMGVVGIFYDEAGYDFGNTRQRQNAAFAAAHQAGLVVFANGHDPDDIFSAKAREPFNPKGLNTSLRRGDHYLYESFGMMLGRAEDADERRVKLGKLGPARALGVRVWGVTTVAADGPPQRAAWLRVVELARNAGLHGLGYGAYEYGATTKRVPFVATERAR